jgi:hypothetical protein
MFMADLPSLATEFVGFAGAPPGSVEGHVGKVRTARTTGVEGDPLLARTILSTIYV